MFDPKQLSHDEEVDWAINSRSVVSKAQVADAFLASLTTRRLDWRSALGSFAVSLHMPHHHFLSSAPGSIACYICGEFESKGVPEDLNILNFERFKWGGLRHQMPRYIGFDLERFLLTSVTPSTPADAATMRRILEVAKSLAPKSKLKDLANGLAKVFPSNGAERRCLIGIMGYCGILQDPEKQSFRVGYPPYMEREETPWYKDDWPYPVQWWNGSHGVSEEAVAFWFPNL